MSDAKHTPGPWRILPEEVDRAYIRVRGSQLGCRYKVANVLTPTYEGALEREALETRANARLIAAAPELLEALQFLVVGGTDLGAGLTFGERIAAAKAAIAKAVGHD